MNGKSRPEAAPKDSAVAAGSASNSTRDQPRSRKLADFYAAREAIAAARDRARAEGRPIRAAEVNEQLRLIDDVIALPDAGEVGDDC